MVCHAQGGIRPERPRFRDSPERRPCPLGAGTPAAARRAPDGGPGRHRGGGECRRGRIRPHTARLRQNQRRNDRAQPRRGPGDCGPGGSPPPQGGRAPDRGLLSRRADSHRCLLGRVVRHPGLAPGQRRHHPRGEHPHEPVSGAQRREPDRTGPTRYLRPGLRENPQSGPGAPARRAPLHRGTFPPVLRILHRGRLGAHPGLGTGLVLLRRCGRSRGQPGDGHARR